MEKAQGLIVNDVVFEVPRPATEDTLGTVTLTDDFTYTGAEEHLAVTPKAALLFKQKLDDLIHTGGGMYVKAPTVTAPTGDDVAVSGAVITATAFTPLVNGATRYNRRFEISKTEDFAELVWSIAKNEDSVEIGVVLENDVDYYVRVKDFCVEGYVSPWSNVHKFNTATGIPAATPTVTAQEDQIFRSVTLVGSAFAMSDGSSDTHKCTDWKIYNGSELVWSSLQDTTNLTQIKTPEVLSENTTYNVEVRYYPTNNLPSAVGTGSFTTVADFGSVVTPTISVQLRDGLALCPIKATSSEFQVTVGTDTHVSTTWKLYKSSEPSVAVWSSEKDESNLTSCTIPADRNTTYIVTCQYHSAKYGDSEIAQVTCTTSNVVIKENYIGVPGTSTFGVGLATKEQYESVQLQPAPNCENENDFQFGLYIRQENGNYGGFDRVALKFIPPFYLAMLQKDKGTVNLSDSELDALLPYVEVTKEQMKEAQRRSPHNAMVVAPFDKFANESDANQHGFYLMRGFVDGGEVQQGFFIANALSIHYVKSGSGRCNFMTTGVLGINDEPATNPVRSNTTWISHTGDISVGPIFKASKAANAKGNFISTLEGTPYQCCSIFAWAVISVLSLIQGQYATDTTQCAWYDSTLMHNYPKGINQNTRDFDDATVTSDTVDGSQGSVFVTQGYEKTTHNGSITGITNVNGWLYQDVIGANSSFTNVLKKTSSIYDITFANVDVSSSSIYETRSKPGNSSYWGGNNSSFPDLTGADKDLFGVYAFGGNTSNNSNEFGSDYHEKSFSLGTIAVGGTYGGNTGWGEEIAGIFARVQNAWTNSHERHGFRAMAYPGTAPKPITNVTLTANGNGGTPETQVIEVPKGTTFGEAKKKLTTPTKTGYTFTGWA